MSPESGKDHPVTLTSPGNALSYLQFILNRTDVAKNLDGHFAAIGVGIKVADLSAFISEPDFIKYLQGELALPEKINLRTALLNVINKIEKEKVVILPEGEAKTHLEDITRGLRESFNIKIKRSPVNNLVQNMPVCWQNQCVSNYFAGEGCETEDSKITDLCSRIVEPGRSAFGTRRPYADHKKKPVGCNQQGHIVDTRHVTPSRWP